MTPSGPIAFTNVRLVDPASGYDGPGGVVVTDGVIADVSHGPLSGLASDISVIDGGCTRRAFAKQT